MTQAFATVAGEPASSVTVHVPQIGPWFAEVELEGAPELSGRVTIALGELELEGTVDESHSGTRGLQRRLRIVAGGGGWGTLLGARAYHADNGVSARTVAEDAAREAGEELGSFAPASAQLAADYVRQSGPASRVLEDVLGGVPWWVDEQGLTQVGTRSSSRPAEGSYEVLEVVPDEHLVTLGVDDLRSIVIGSVLSAGLDEEQTVRELELVVSADAVRVRAWCGGSATSRDRLVDALGAFVDRRTDRRLFGLWRYRVVQMSGDRLELQAVRRAAGLPDILPISMWPGVAGAHAHPAGGSECLVQFVEGDRTMPIVTHYVGKDSDDLFVPNKVTFSVQPIGGRILLGTTVEGDTIPVSLADRTDARLDKISAALDAFVAAVAVPNDGGAFLQETLAAIWGSTPHETVNTGSIAVRAIRGVGLVEG
jgi:hypothetical protein